MNHRSVGFTIVELLIVIVVIAILAAISIVSFTGIQQRSRNAAIVQAASQSIKAIQAYRSSTSQFPSTGGASICITVATGCVRDDGTVENGNATFENNIKTIATLPQTVPATGDTGYGIAYNYNSTRTYNGDQRSMMLFYWLEGTNQKCGLGNVMSAWTTAVTATNGYTSGNAANIGKTLCLISIPN